MVEETKEELTEEQIEEHLLKKDNVRKDILGLEMVVSDKRSSLDPYIHIIYTEGSDLVNPPGNKIIPRINVHLEYHLNPLSKKLIEKIFNTDTEIKVFYPSKRGNSTYAQREAQTLQDVDEILDLAEKYHSIVRSSSYNASEASLRNLSGNLAEEFSNILLTI